MNTKQAVDWFKAAGSGRAKRLQKVLSGLEGAGRWEIGLASREPLKTLDLRYFGAEGEADRFRKAAARSLGLRWQGRLPSSHFPWLSFAWDLATDRPGEILAWSVGKTPEQAAAGGRIARVSPFDPAIAAVFSEFTSLCPVKEMVSCGKDWSLRLARPVAWPHFIRTNMADPFLGAATELAYLLLDRKVTELAVSEDSLRAYVRG